jgi:hypothetical protein
MLGEEGAVAGLGAARDLLQGAPLSAARDRDLAASAGHAAARRPAGAGPGTRRGA